jgi:hypothetical protein
MGGKRGKGPVAKKAHKIRMDKLIARARAIAAGKGVAPATCTGDTGVQGNDDETEEELTAALQEAFPMLDAELVQLLVAECTEDGAHLPDARPADERQRLLRSRMPPVCPHPANRVLVCTLRTNPCTCLALHLCGVRRAEETETVCPPPGMAKETGGARTESGG